MIHLRRALALLILTIATALSMAQPVQAGTYTVHGCRLPSGAIAPTNGWVGTGSGMYVTTSNACNEGGGLLAALDDGLAHKVGDEAKWTFQAPANTRIIRFAGHRASRVGGGQAYGSPEVILGIDSSYLERCARAYGCNPGNGNLSSPTTGGNAFSFTELDTSSVYFVAVCGGLYGYTCPAEAPSSVGALFRAEIGLSDTLDPQVSHVSGELTEAGPHRGAQWVTFSATDQGAGIYRGIIEVDGATLVDEAFDVNGGKCVDAEPGDADIYEFVDKQPCKLSLSGSLRLDTTRLGDGDHTMRVRVVDAAGNASTVHGPAAFEVRNQQQPSPPGPGQPNTGTASNTTSTNHSSVTHTTITETSRSAARGAVNGANGSGTARIRAIFDRNGQASMLSRYGRRVVVRGRLTDATGAGIGNAVVDVTARSIPKGSSIRTRPDGSFVLVLPASAPSQQVRLGYRSHMGDSIPAATASLALKVRAAVRLTITPRAVRNRQSVTFRGRLLGRPIPRRGKLIEIQVRFPSGWKTFRTVRTNSRGAFKFRYRFMRSYQPITYSFRARSRSDGSYPYETGSSQTVRVRVR